MIRITYLLQEVREVFENFEVELSLLSAPLGFADRVKHVRAAIQKMYACLINHITKKI